LLSDPVADNARQPRTYRSEFGQRPAGGGELARFHRPPERRTSRASQGATLLVRTAAFFCGKTEKLAQFAI